MMSGGSTGAVKVDQVFLYITALSVAFLLLITALMVYFVVRFRRRPGVRAEDIEGNVRLEVAWTVIPLALFLSMFYYGWINYRYLRTVPRDALVVKVVARQWAWSFTYPDGRQSTELVLAVNRPVKLELSSLDVVHGFYIPAFRVKEDVVPGKGNYTWFQPTELGAFDIECTVICGVNHAYMLAKARILTEQQFGAWYASPPGQEEGARGLPGLAVRMPAGAADGAHGEQRFRLKGCVACHSTDGSKLVGPSLKGVYGRQVAVVTAGLERTVTADEEYLMRSIRDPKADIVRGYEAEMTRLDVADQDVAQIVAFLKTLK